MAGEHILVVDDGADMREFVIKYVLEPNNYQYTEAKDGVEAFNAIIKNPPDLILLDLQMPRLDGIGLLNKLRDEQINIPVILMTFYGSEEIAIEVFRLGVRDYVIKPFTEEEILGAIERAMTLTRLRRERDSLTERLVYANRELERQVKALEALFRVGKVVARLPDETTLMTRILEAVGFLTDAEESALLLLTDDRTELVSRAVQAGGAVEMVYQGVNNPLAMQAIQTGQITISQPYNNPSTGYATIQINVPLITGEDGLGTLSIVIQAEQAARHQLRVLGALADYTAIGLEHLRLVGR